MEGVSKREFLRITSTFCGGLLLSFDFSLAVAGEKAQKMPPPWQSLFLTVHPDNSVILKVPKFEMGQGVSTGFAMVFADEMGLDLHLLRVEHAAIDGQFGDTFQGVSGGSGSIQDCWSMLREVAAKSRELFVLAASEKWQVPRATCQINRSFVYRTGSSDKLSLGELLPLVAGMKEPSEVALKDTREFQYIGKPLPKIWGTDIVQGKMKFGIDVVVPGMVHASIERCPFFQGKIKSYDDSKARKIPGVIDIFKIEGIWADAYSENISPPYQYSVAEGVVVVAQSTWTAIKARKELDIEWERGRYGAVNTPASLHNQILVKKKEAPLALGKASQETGNLMTISESYVVDYQAHALMEPLNAVASCQGVRCEIWIGHQFGKRVREQASKILGFESRNVEVHIVASGGAFGRRWEADFALEAIFVSKRMQRPVKLQWTREDEIRFDYYHAFEQHDHEVTVRRSGEVVSWICKQYTCDNMPGGFANYYFHHLKEKKVDVVPLDAPLQAGSWRSVATHRKTFSLECLIDSMASSLKKSPLEYRLELLDSVPAGDQISVICKRIRNLLLFVKDKFPGISKKGLGIAVTQLRGYCVTVAEIEEVRDGFNVKKIAAFVDCGLVVNPSQVRGQIEGGIIWGLQAVCHGGITLSQGKVAQSNFHDYQMIRMAEVPEIEIHLMPGDGAPLGVGELGVPGVAPAISNAVLSLTGQNRKSIPFKNFLP